MLVELKTQKKCTKMNFYGQEVPYNMHCDATAVLKVDSVNKQGKKYHPQVNVKEYKYTDAESSNKTC